MKIRSGSVIVEELLPDAAQGKLEVEDALAEILRLVKRLRGLLVTHFESARRLGVVLGMDHLRAVIVALLAKANGLSLESH